MDNYFGSLDSMMGLYPWGLGPAGGESGGREPPRGGLGRGTPGEGDCVDNYFLSVDSMMCLHPWCLGGLLRPPAPPKRGSGGRTGGGGLGGVSPAG